MINYEKALKGLNEMYAVLNDSSRWQKNKHLLEEVLSQHKSPTFDDVERVALNNNFEVWEEKETRD